MLFFLAVFTALNSTKKQRKFNITPYVEIFYQLAYCGWLGLVMVLGSFLRQGVLLFGIWQGRGLLCACSRCRMGGLCFIFMPPTSKKLTGHIGFWLSLHASIHVCIRLSRTVHDRVLKFHIWIPHIKIADTHFFSCPSYLPFLSYAPLKNSKWNLVSKISRKVFELGAWNLVSC